MYIIEGHKEIEVLTVGELDIFDSETNINEGTVGQIKLGSNPGIVKICVYENEGPIPHFHTIDKQTNGRKFNCCLCIYEAKYFSHGNKTDKLTNKQLSILNDWLNSTSINEGVETTMWWNIAFAWNFIKAQLGKPNNKPSIPRQPDYTKCNETESV